MEVTEECLGNMQALFQMADVVSRCLQVSVAHTVIYMACAC
jgi:hypothetical protein